MNVPEKHAQQQFTGLEPELPGALALFCIFHPPIGVFLGSTQAPSPQQG